MTYETVVTELFQRFLRLQTIWETRFDSMRGESSVQHVVFGSILIPALDEALSTGDLASILRFCAFLEDVAEAAQKDNSLRMLLQIEVGEWLGGAAHESMLTPWLGTETKRICEYVPGLATKRLALREEQRARSLGSRFSKFFRWLRVK
jgi:hypothetical protein